jgi:DNA-nicking Smr family endonuclease
VEVEIEDGFSIPVLQTELVIVAAEESIAFYGAGANDTQETKKKASQTGETSKEKGFNIAVVPLNDKLHSIYLLSAEKQDALVMVNEINGKSEERTILSEKLFSGAFIKLTERNIDHLNTWPSLSITILKEINQWSIAEKPEKIILKIKSKHFQKEPQFISTMSKAAYLIPLQATKSTTIQPTVIDTDHLRNEMFTVKAEQSGNRRVPTAEREIDLHIEAIRKDADQIPKDQILSIQLQTFEQKLNQAIMTGEDEIVFIHGVGNGVLKNKIHKYLSQSDNIKFFKDAHKEKFGYGATLIRIN